MIIERSGKWTLEEITLLKDKYETTDIYELCKLLNRNNFSIYNKAKKLKLKNKGKELAINEVALEKVRNFIYFLGKTRSTTKAYSEANTQYTTVKSILAKNKELNEEFQKLKKYLKSTFRCRFCREIFENKACYMDIENHAQPHKICKPCHYKKINNYRETFTGHISALLSGAKNRHYDFNLNIEFIKELYEKQNGKCYYINIPIKLHCDANKLSDDLMTLDRIDPTKGYTQDNVVLSSWIANRMKTDLSLDKFIEYCKIITDKFNKSETSSAKFL